MGPDTYTDGLGNYYYFDTSPCEFWWLTTVKSSNLTYNTLLKQGWTPQQARSILPNSLKTELVMTGTVEQWKGFFKLRCDKAAHPQARELAIPLKEEFIKRNLINN